MYNLRVWEARRILRGYNRRNRIEQQLLRMAAYSSFYAFRENKFGKTPSEWLPLPWEADLEDEETAPPISEEERQELVDLMASINAAPPTNSKSDEQ